MVRQLDTVWKSAFDLFHPMDASSFDNMFSQRTAVEVKILPVAGILINFPIFCRLLSVENHQRESGNHIKTPFNSNIVVNGNERFNYCNFLTGMFVMVGGVRKFCIWKVGENKHYVKPLFNQPHFTLQSHELKISHSTTIHRRTSMKFTASSHPMSCYMFDKYLSVRFMFHQRENV